MPENGLRMNRTALDIHLQVEGKKSRVLAPCPVNRCSRVMELAKCSNAWLTQFEIVQCRWRA